MCALRSHIQGLAALRSKSGVWPRYAPPALFVGYRIDRALQFGLPRAGVSTPPPLVSPLRFSPSSGGGIELPRHSSGDGLRVEPARIFITFAAVYFAPFSMPPLRGAVGGRAAELSRQPRGPPPRVFRPAGAPAPLFRPPPRYAGERLSLRSHFFSATASGGGGGGWGRLTRPLRPRRRGAPCSLRSRCAPSPPRPLRRVASSAWRALRDPPASVAPRRAPAAAPRRVRVARYEMSWVSQKNRYATGFPLPTSAEPVFFGNPPCDISHRD